MKRILIVLLLCPLSLSASNIKSLILVSIRLFLKGNSVKTLETALVEMPASIRILHDSTDDHTQTHTINCEIVPEADDIKVSLRSKYEHWDEWAIHQEHIIHETYTLHIPPCCEESHIRTCTFKHGDDITTVDINISKAS